MPTITPEPAQPVHPSQTPNPEQQPSNAEQSVNDGRVPQAERRPLPSLRALRIDPHSSQLELVDAARLGAADHAGISGTGYRSMTLGTGLALLVDDRARQQSEPLNVWATVVTHTFGSNVVVFGSALAFAIGFDDRQMRTVTTLQDAQVRRLAGAIVGPLDLAVFERITESLRPFPGALTYLANIGTRAQHSDAPEPAEPARTTLAEA